MWWLKSSIVLPFLVIIDSIFRYFGCQKVPCYRIVDDPRSMEGMVRGRIGEFARFAVASLRVPDSLASNTSFLSVFFDAQEAIMVDQNDVGGSHFIAGSCLAKLFLMYVAGCKGCTYRHLVAASCLFTKKNGMRIANGTKVARLDNGLDNTVGCIVSKRKSFQSGGRCIDCLVGSPKEDPIHHQGSTIGNQVFGQNVMND
mmetsp:Transcript_21298/g.35230  ORF Transcript_21298/g.35230 Transcript_21298/m.35230 type:complete len:200 (-) Transcript_21298:60-659(-)